MNDERILAEYKFETAYKNYTEASNRVFNATTDEERKAEWKSFEKAGREFNIAYQKLRKLDD